MVWKRRPFKAILSLGNRKKSAGLSPENRVDETRRMSDVLPDNCGRGAMREPAHCRGATSKSGFPTIQASSRTQLPSNALKLPGTIVCCQNLTLGSLNSRSALSVLVGALFKKFGLFSNTPRILHQGQLGLHLYPSSNILYFINILFLFYFNKTRRWTLEKNSKHFDPLHRVSLFRVSEQGSCDGISRALALCETKQCR